MNRLVCSAVAAAAALIVPALMAPIAAAAPPPLDFVPSLGGSSPGAACGGNVLCVGPDGSFATIGGAVAAAPSGATIQVQSGTYPEAVTVDKPLSLLGGFDSTFSTRNPSAAPSTVNAGQADSVFIVNTAGDFWVDGFVITGGKAILDEFGGGGGSGINVEAAQNATITNNVIEGNVDGQPFSTCGCRTEGGGIRVTDVSSALIRSNIIRNNGAQHGAGIALFSSGQITGNLIEDNDAVSDHGGGLHLTGLEIVLNRNLIRGNSIGSGAGYGWGGGVNLFATTSGEPVNGTIKHNRIVGNIAPTIGSGFFVDEGAKATFFGDLMHGNVCPQNGGAGLFIDGGDNGSGQVGSSAKLENVTITGHSCGAGTNGTGLYVEGGSGVKVTNSIITRNGGGSDVMVCTAQNLPCAYEPDIKPSSLDYSLIEGKVKGLTPGVGMQSADPAFVAPGSGDFHLTAGSPAINAGDPSSPVLDEPEPNGGRRNLGAYGGTSEAATGTGGPPIVEPAVTKFKKLKYKGKKIAGKIASSRACRKGRAVQLLAGKKTVAKTKANAKGKFVFKVKGKTKKKLGKKPPQVKASQVSKSGLFCEAAKAKVK